MIRVFILPALVLLLAGVGVGFMLDPRSSGPEAAERTDRWTPLSMPTDYSQSSERFRQSLFEGSLFPAPESSQAVVSVDPSESGEDVKRPPFPLVLSIARIDGTVLVQLRLPGGEIINAGVGQGLPGDWVITEVSLDSVVATHSGDTFTVDLTNSDPPS